MSSRKSAHPESVIEKHVLTEREHLESLHFLKDIAASSRGVCGKIKVIQNSVGGHMTLTSSSSRLYNLLSIAKPLLQLILFSAQNHLKRYSDCGLFVLVLTLDIIDLSLKCSVNGRCLIEIYEEILDFSLKTLNADCFPAKMSTSFSNVTHMTSLVKSLLRSKPLCKLSESDLELLSSQLLECFTLSTIHDQKKKTDGIFILSLEGPPVNNSKLICGLLLSSPEIPHFNIKSIKAARNSNQQISVVVVTGSMSGDSEEVMIGKYETSCEITGVTTVLSEITQFCDWVIKEKIAILFCQKVVHPRVKCHLRKNGVFVMDRLGIQMINYVLDITDSSAIDSFSCCQNYDNSLFGTVDSIEHVILHNKSYVLLTQQKSRMCTFLLCSPQEEVMSELQVLCRSTLTTLQNILENPVVLCGGGCWEVCLSQKISALVRGEKKSLLADMGFSSHIISLACECIKKSLLRVALTAEDSNHHLMTAFPSFHCWRVPVDYNFTESQNLKCACGLIASSTDCLQFINDKNLETSVCDERADDMKIYTLLQETFATSQGVVDSFDSSVSAFKTALITANTVLSVGQCIQEKH